HIPRSERLADPVNLRQLREIDEDYPGADVVVAHVGRAYCPRFSEGLEDLRDTQNINFDISANTNQDVFERLLDTIDPGRILYGSDLPILAMHSRRICEGDNYVNIVLGADWKDGHTRSGGPGEGIAFFLYEVIAAFLRAARNKGLSEDEIAKVFYSNGARILGIG
ncbi:MAG: amidohydrolase family protein, partial [Theionarchaea archaeon]|nr:amidohydrolase family protein [Theionarchaea archaeon]